MPHLLSSQGTTWQSYVNQPALNDGYGVHFDASLHLTESTLRYLSYSPGHVAAYKLTASGFGP